MKRTGICTLLLIGGLGTLLADGIDSSVPFYYTVNGGTEEMPLDWSESATSPTRFVKLKTDETGFVYTNWLNASFRLDGTKKVLYWAMGATYRDFGVYARTLNCATMTTGWHWEQPTDYGFMMYPRLVLEAEPDGINVTEAIIPTYNTQSEDPRGLRLCGTVDPSLAGKTILATLSNAALVVQERYAFTARADGKLQASIPLPAFLGEKYREYSLSLSIVETLPEGLGANYALEIADAEEDEYGPVNADFCISPYEDGHMGLRSVLNVRVNPKWMDAQGRRILEYAQHNMWKEYDDTYPNGQYGGFPADGSYHKNGTRECFLYPRTFLVSSVRCHDIGYVHTADHSEVAFTGVADPELARRKVSVRVTNERTGETRTYEGKVGSDLSFRVVLPEGEWTFLSESAAKSSLSSYLVSVEVEKKSGFKIVIR